MYAPRHPEDTVLYQAVAWNLESFLAEAQQGGRTIPAFVERELRSLLTCGIAACGFVRLRCESCGTDKVVPFSCKGRGVCTSCGARRMADTAAYLVDRVFPILPPGATGKIRQWVLSLPYGLRYALAFDPKRVTAVYRIFTRAIFSDLRARARRGGIRKSQCGSVTFVQRFGGSVNLNVHFHALLPDGVWAKDREGRPQFHALEAPSDEDIQRVVKTIAQRVRRLQQRWEGDADPLQEEPGLPHLYAASIVPKKRSRGAHDEVDPENLEDSPRRCARADGFSLHADVAVPLRDRDRLERLARYVARPALSEDRLDGTEDGRLVYTFKRRWRDGTDRIVFEPTEFIGRLATLIPKPRAHLVRYSGVWAPAAKWRSAVVPATIAKEADFAEASTVSERTANTAKQAEKRRRNYLWSELLRRTFGIDALACDCGGRLKPIAAIHPPETTKKILECLGLPSRPPPVAPARIADHSLEF